MTVRFSVRSFCVFTVAAMILQVSACDGHLSGSKRADGEIIERSKQSRPVWADSPTGKLLTNNTENKVHVEMLRQKDLPIAIKLAQSTAVESSYTVWRGLFDEKLKTFSSLLEAKNTKNGEDFDQTVEQVARKYHAKSAQIEDIYYERIQLSPEFRVGEYEDLTEYFDVHVLVQLNPFEQSDLQASLAAAFQNSKYPELKKAAKAMTPARR